MTEAKIAEGNLTDRHVADAATADRLADAGIGLPDQGVLSLTASANHLEKMLHKATIDGFEMVSDEPEFLGGGEAHPYPLHYFLSGIALCTVTQIMWFARLRKVAVDDVQVDVQLTWSRSGSAKRGDLSTQAHAMVTHIDVISDAPADEVAELVRIAEAGCFARTAVQQPVPVLGTVKLNGETLEPRGSSG